MKLVSRFLYLLALCYLPLYMLAQPNSPIELKEGSANGTLLNKAKSLRFVSPDRCINVLDTCYKNLILEGDTLNAMKVLAEQAKVYGHQAKYKNSYDKLWKALLLADKAQLDLTRAYLYLDIGRYYSFYKRREKAIEYFDLAMQISKRLVQEQKIEPAYLADFFYTYCATYRELNEPELGKRYLDSCLAVHQNGISKITPEYLEFEKAFLLKENQLFDSAIHTFQRVIPIMEKEDPGYQTLVYTYLGDTYEEKGSYDESERCFKKALEISATYKSHIDFTPLIHQKLSDLYFERGDLASAYQRLKQVKELDERFFDSRSQNNLPLLEIQDAFRLEKELQEKRLKEQKLTQLESEEKVLFLQRTILIVGLLFLTLIGFIYFNHVRSKHKSEKQLIRKKQELEIQKANEIVSLKNRELSTSTLKLIEKDELIGSLKNRLAQNGDNITLHEVKRILNTISVGNEQNWREFEARFIDVNKDFYTRLKAEYPSLTQGDLKLCALIKLNFSSKDMAKLMGISVESVHTTRYRLRKKLGLKREVNLTEFIADI